MHGFNLENEGEKMKRFRFEEAQRHKREKEELEREQKYLEAEMLLEEERKRQERLKQERIEKIRRVRVSAVSVLDAAAVHVVSEGEEQVKTQVRASVVKAVAALPFSDVNDRDREEVEKEPSNGGVPSLSQSEGAEGAGTNVVQEDQGKLALEDGEEISGSKGQRAVLWVAQYASHLAAEGDAQGWFYLDEQTNVQGPFTSEDMASWRSQNYLDSDLLIRWGEGETYVRLGTLFPDDATAFSSDEIEQHLKEAYRAMERMIRE